MRATEPLPLVPVMWMTGYAVLRVAEHVDQAPHAVEREPSTRPAVASRLVCSSR